MKNNILEDAKQWVRELLYKNGVRLDDPYIFDNAENELETFLEKMRIQGAIDYKDTIHRSTTKEGYTNKDILFLRKINKKCPVEFIKEKSASTLD